MRTLTEAQSTWKNFCEQTLDNYRQSVQTGDREAVSENRSGVWKRCLLFKGDSQAEWFNTLRNTRSYYRNNKLRLLKPLSNQDESDAFSDPLSEAPDSQWEALRRDEALRQEILQDVDRCMPENLYFRQPETQMTLLDVLFVWSKLHPDVSYRQGMHEVLALVLWTVERDAIDPATVTDTSLETPQEFFTATHIEADCFTLFDYIMMGIASSYLGTTRSNPTVEPPMVTRGRRILEEYLMDVDPKLSLHLARIEVLPQVFLMRWLRLLFGREFDFDSVLTLWDALFLQDPLLKTVDMICVSILLRLRWDLLEADGNEALTLLLRIPLAAVPDPASLVSDALYLKSHMSPAAGSDIIYKTTGRMPETVEPPRTPCLGATTSQPSEEQTTPSRFGGKLLKTPGNIESLLQDAARGVYQRSEKLGINKAVREAVGEVRRNVRDLQSARIEKASHSRQASATIIHSYDDMVAIEERVQDLQRRSQQLAKMLETAVAELWRQHEIVSQSSKTSTKHDKDATEALAMSIAKVQLAQVYLEDDSIPLPPLEEFTGATASNASDSTVGFSKPAAAVEKNSLPPRKSSRAAVKKPAERKGSAASDAPDRPSLAQSSYSWMLGQDDKSAQSSFMSATPFTEAPDRRNRGSHGFLFGDAAASAREESPSKHLKRDKEKDVKKDATSEAFDLGQPL